MGAIATGIGVGNEVLNVLTQRQPNELADGLRGTWTGIKGDSQYVAVDVGDIMAVVANSAAKGVVGVF